VSAPEAVAGPTLRVWRDDDAAALIGASGDPLLQRWTTVRTADPGAAQQWLRVQDTGRRLGTRYSCYWTAAYARGLGVAPYPQEDHLHLRRRADVGITTAG
jgi:hypothetical protein